MAIEFKNVKSPKLDLSDKITFGKLSGCRVCDVIEDHYEYLIWAEKSGFIKFTDSVIEVIQKQAGFKQQQQHYEQEVKPWLDEDVPF